MSFGASKKNVSSAVSSPARRMQRFIQTRTSIGSLGRSSSQQSVRTSTNPAKSVGMLGDSRKVK